jgi:hypothetical protein
MFELDDSDEEDEEEQATPVKKLAPATGASASKAS